MDESTIPAVEDQIPADGFGAAEGAAATAANEPTPAAPDTAAQIASLQAQVASYEAEAKKRDIAEALGLPPGMYKRIMGETEAEWREDAKALQRLFSAQRKMTVPGMSYENAGAENPIEAALRKLIGAN